MNDLNVEVIAAKKCKPCEGGVVPFSAEQARGKAAVLTGWTLSSDAKKIEAEWRMRNFTAAVALINAIAGIAEEEDHHPDIHLTAYRNLRVELTTHAIGGLSENDLIMAAKIQKLPKTLKAS